MTSADVVAEIVAVRETVAGWFETDRSDWTAADRSNALRALLELKERAEAVVAGRHRGLGSP